MALVPIDNIVQKILRMLKKVEPHQGVEILSYKRNRGVSILLNQDESFWLREHGYNEEEFHSEKEELPKLLKTIIKREFPRSRKLRVYQLSGPDKVNQPRKKL